MRQIVCVWCAHMSACMCVYVHVYHQELLMNWMIVSDFFLLRQFCYVAVDDLELTAVLLLLEFIAVCHNHLL